MNNSNNYFFNGQRLKRGGQRKTHAITTVLGRRPINTTNRSTRLPSVLKTIQPIMEDSSTTTSSSSFLKHNDEPECKLKIGYLNAQSCRNKADELNDLLTEKDLDILLITETWLYPTGDESIISLISPPNYTAKSFPRSDRRGGGLMIIYRNDLESRLCVKIPVFTHSSFEAIEFTIDVGSKVFNVICIYRLQYSTRNRISNSHFICEFEDLLAHLNTVKGVPVIVGDFNFHYDSCESSEVKRLKEILLTNNMTQLIDQPTHRKNHIIDWVVMRKLDVDNTIHEITNIKKITSDHNFIMVTLNTSRPKTEKRTITTRNIKNIKIDEMKMDINTKIPTNTDINELNEKLCAILNKHAPQKEKTVTSRRYAPWYNEDIRSAKREYRKAERAWQKSGKSEDKHLVVIRRSLWKALMKKSKKQFYLNKFRSTKSKKQCFKICDELLGRTSVSILPNSYSERTLPSVFSTFFNEKVKGLRDNLDTCEIADTFEQHPGDQIFSFKTVSEDFVKEIILKSTPTTCELDPIPTSLLNSCLDEILPAITHVINVSLSTGHVPQQLKQAVIKPLLKKKTLDQNVLKNYRPVSNLPFISKILEKVVLSQLLEHLKSQDLLEPFQSAYRPNHCTESALLKVMNDMLVEADSGNVVLLGLLDLSSAFDTIDHNILLKRLEFSFGIGGTCLEWFKSYLVDRKQSVSVNGIKSDSQVMEFGVPQGSVLGPILFTLYTQPLAKEITKFNFRYHFYADDTQIYSSSTPENFDSLVSSFQNCFSSIKNWMDLNRLVLNSDKTEILVLGTPKSRNKISISSITVCDAEVKLANSAKNLGIFFDSDFSMSTTVNNLLKKINFNIHNINHIKHLLPQDVLTVIVNSLILSQLDYCNSLLFGITHDRISKLQIAQNNAARLIFNKSKKEHATPLLEKLHWLPVEKRIIYKLLTLCHNYIYSEAPLYMSTMLSFYSPKRCLRSSNDRTKLIVPKTRLKTIGDKSFSHCAPKLWNNLPSSLRETQSLGVFKKKLKTFLF